MRPPKSPGHSRSTELPAQAVAPSRSIRQSERPLVKLGIRIFGYDRLLRWFKQTKSLRGRAMAAVHPPSRRIMARRGALIASLKAEPDVQASKAADHIAKGAMRQASDLKIALLIPSFQMAKGGAEKVAGRLANTLLASGSAVHIFCRPPPRAGAAYTANEGVVIRNGIETNDTHIDQLAGDGFDLLIGFGMPGFFARIPEIAERLNVPFVIQECNNPDYIARNLLGTHGCLTKESAYWLRQAVFSHAAGVRLTVPYYASSVEPAARPFVHAFYNALIAPKTKGGAPKSKLIAVGAMKNEKKNGLTALRAFCAFTTQHPNWSLHLYGENNFRAKTQELMAQYPNAEIVDHGVVDNTDAIYEDAHALLIPSYDEGLPNVVVEAFSYGVPCIGYADCSGVKHLISHETTGLLLDRSEPRSLEGALETISDASLRDRMSCNARNFAQENLDVASWEKNWLNLITHAANGMDASGVQRQPAAYDLANAAAPRWRELLASYHHFPG